MCFGHRLGEDFSISLSYFFLPLPLSYKMAVLRKGLGWSFVLSRLSAVRLCVVPVTLWDLGKHQLLCYVLNRKVSPKLTLM